LSCHRRILLTAYQVISVGLKQMLNRNDLMRKLGRKIKRRLDCLDGLWTFL
jgi:hypothetical protein